MIYLKRVFYSKSHVSFPRARVGEGPEPEEMLMAMKTGEGKISLKSGYDKYLRKGIIAT